jgi:hypothetical protein
VLVDFCRECRGFLCAPATLARLLGGVDAPRGRPRAVALDGGRPCPVCGAAAFEVFEESMGGTAYEACSACGAHFLDGSTLTAWKRRTVEGRKSRPVAATHGAAARSSSVPAEPAAVDRNAGHAPSADAERAFWMSTRLPFDHPTINRVAIPIAFTIAVLLYIVPFTRLLMFPVVLAFHELGHALFAWLGSRAALPLPFGFTFVREDPSTVTYLCFTFLLGVSVHYAYRQRRLFPIVVVGCLFVLQVLLTFVVSEATSTMWFVFFGAGGELVLSALVVVAFYYPGIDRLRWDFWRFVALVPAAFAFVHAFALWNGVSRGSERIPFGSFLGGEGTGDMERLVAEHGFTDHSLVSSYVALAYACLVVVVVHTGVQTLRTTRRAVARQ